MRITQPSDDRKLEGKRIKVLLPRESTGAAERSQNSRQRKGRE